MRDGFTTKVLAGTILILFVMVGCSQSSSPSVSTPLDNTITSAESVVSQDLGQLSTAGVTSARSYGTFSVGWNKFVGPNIASAGIVGQAFVVVHQDTVRPDTRAGGIDIGTVSLQYSGTSTDLIKRITRNGSVLYSTFDRGLGRRESIQVNIPFIAGGTYTFAVSGSTLFSSGNFQITAPQSLLDITNYTDRDTISVSAGLTVLWTGGSSADSVLVRLVPHLRPQQLEDRERRGPHDPEGRGLAWGRPNGPMGPRPMAGPLQNFGPEFQRGVVRMVANTGSITFSATELQSLLINTEAGELMIGVTQVVKQTVQHDGKPLDLILRNGDSVVLRVHP